MTWENPSVPTPGENKFRALLEAAPDAVLIVDANGTIVLVNGQTEKMFGYSREELLGKPVEMLVPQRHRHTHSAHRGNYNASPRVRMMGSGMELLGLRRDGSEFPVEISLSPAESEDGFQVFSTIRDVTDRKRLEEDLRRAKKELEQRVETRTSELARANLALEEETEQRKRSQADTERLALIVESSEDAIIGKTLEGQIVSWNRAAERLYGYTASEAIGRHISILAPANRKDEISEILEKLKREENVRHFETVRVTKDGRPLDVSLSIFPVRDAAGVPVAAATIARDITQRKQMENQLRQAHKMEAIGRLAGGIAHDFNNLLGVILGDSELLLINKRLDPQARSRIEEIKLSGENAASLTRQLLAFSRQQMFETRVLDLNTALNGFESMLRRLLGAEFELTFSLTPDLGKIRADASQLLQVVLNLVVNARDAMKRGGRIRIETANVVLDDSYADMHPGTLPGPHVMLSVSDNGPGMDSETLSHIFEPFFSTKKGAEASGLGLATVYGIVQQSNGSIWVYSEPGQGTIFKIYLRTVEDTPGSTQREEFVEEFPRGTETVLLVEDSQLLRRITKEFLSQIGYTVIVAENGAEALAIAAKYGKKIDLLFTDLAMPGMNGQDLADKMLAERRGLKVLFTSGYAGSFSLELASAKGHAAFIEKPASWRDLATKVRALLDQS